MIRGILFHLPPTGRDAFPISLGYIAASLEANGVDVHIEDLTRKGTGGADRTRALVRDREPDFGGFSAYQANIESIFQIAGTVKNVDPGIVTVLGGPQAAFMPREALRQMPMVDILCRGEGETILPMLVRCIERKLPLEGVDGIVHRVGSSIDETSPAPLTKDLDRFPSPYAAGVFDFRDHSIASMLTSRGCPFSCSFCYTPKFYRSEVQVHSVEHVLGDIQTCLASGVNTICFYDPSFTVDRIRVQRIMRGIVDRGWKVSLWCETRADLVDRETLALMAAAGMKEIAYGLEATNPETLDAIQKHIDCRKFADTVRLTQDLGIEVEVFTLYALPKQTYEAALQTIDFLRNLGIRLRGNSSGQQMSLFFGTDMWRSPEAFGIRPVEKDRPLFLSPGQEFVTDCMNADEIGKIKKILDEEHLYEEIMDDDNLMSRISGWGDGNGKISLEEKEG